MQVNYANPLFVPTCFSSF